MNERIAKLIEQATIETLDLTWGKTHVFSAEKFAELIVKECASLVQGVPTDTMGYHVADQKIKQHFGVK